VVANSRDPSTPLRCARDDSAGLRFPYRIVPDATRSAAHFSGGGSPAPWGRIAARGYVRDWYEPTFVDSPEDRVLRGPETRGGGMPGLRSSGASFQDAPADALRRTDAADERRESVSRRHPPMTDYRQLPFPGPWLDRNPPSRFALFLMFPGGPVCGGEAAFASAVA